MRVISVLEVSPFGYYCNSLSESHVKSEKLLELNDWILLLRCELNDNIVSIFLRGSTATGNDSIESDIDVIVVLNTNDFITKSKINNISITRKYKYDLCIISISDLMNIKTNRSLQFITKTQSICIFGKDLRKNIIEFNVSLQNTVHLFHLREYLNIFSNSSNISNNNEKNLKLCSWLMKAIVRAGLELVVERENIYTRDLEKCCEIFAKYYPIQEKNMNCALQLAIYPISNLVDNIKLGTELVDFIEIETKKELKK